MPIETESLAHHHASRRRAAATAVAATVSVAAEKPLTHVRKPQSALIDSAAFFDRVAAPLQSETIGGSDVATLPVFNYHTLDVRSPSGGKKTTCERLK